MAQISAVPGPPTTKVNTWPPVSETAVYPEAAGDELIWAEVNLDAIRANVRSLRFHIGNGVRLAAVVKANAYGHGAGPVATTVLSAGADSLAVGRLSEAVNLRNVGVVAPILLMGPMPISAAVRCVQLRITPTIQDLLVAQSLAHAARAVGRTVPVHVKVDTGMARFGALADEAVALTSAVAAIDGLEVEGLYTHFAATDAEGLASTKRQLSCLLDIDRELRAIGVAPSLLHAANSAATLMLADAHLDQVRVGGALYGFQSFGPLELRPALSLKARIIRLRRVPPGTPVSYGSTYRTKNSTCLATLAAGYGDGLRIACSSGGGRVLLNGNSYPIVGRVCMDQLVVDCRDGTGIQEGDAAVLIGCQGDDAITAEELAESSGTLNYDVVTGLSDRVRRLYFDDPLARTEWPDYGRIHLHTDTQSGIAKIYSWPSDGPSKGT